MSLLLLGWSLAALSLHVVRTPTKIGLIPKERLGFTDTYVDARTWSLSDLSNHPVLVKRVLEANKADLFRYLTDQSNDDVAGQVANAIGQPSPSQKATNVFGRVKGFFTSNSASHATEAGIDSIPLPVDF